MLRNRTEKEEKKLKGVILAVNELKLQPGRFVSLVNWIPGKVHKLKKKRGVVPLSGTAVDISTPSTCGVGLTVSANRALNCHNGILDVTLTAAGGSAPYTWATTKGIITPGIPTSTAVLTPAANPGSAVAGDAFLIAAKFMPGFCDCVCRAFGCDDVANSACTGVGCNSCWPTTCSCTGCANGSDSLFRTDPIFDNCGKPYYVDGCTGLEALHRHCDVRTAEMISGGCNPCSISMDGGAVVTVTDNQGTSAFVAVDSL